MKSHAPDGVRRRALLAGAVGSAAGCTLWPDVDHDGPDAPRAMPLAKRPRVAWVFSSGGPRGFVHVGVLKALDELRLKPELIVGASVGALVGALYGSGLSAQAIEALAFDLGPTTMGRLAFGSEGGERFNGAPIADLVRRHALHRLLEDMPVRVACAAVRLRDAQAVALTAGDVGVAVQASAAVEGQFTPVRLRGEPFVDPDWHMPLPVRLARALGARQVIAVDASAHEDRAPPGAERYRQGDVRKRALVRADAQHADLVLHPDFGYWVNMSREFRERSIAAGYRDTIAAAARLKKLHAA